MRNRFLILTKNEKVGFQKYCHMYLTSHNLNNLEWPSCVVDGWGGGGGGWGVGVVIKIVSYE